MVAQRGPEVGVFGEEEETLLSRLRYVITYYSNRIDTQIDTPISNMKNFSLRLVWIDKLKIGRI